MFKPGDVIKSRITGLYYEVLGVEPGRGVLCLRVRGISPGYRRPGYTDQARYTKIGQNYKAKP